MKNNRLVFGVLLLMVLLPLNGCAQPQASSEIAGSIDISQEPAQSAPVNFGPIIKKAPDSQFTLTAQASYTIAARVKGKEDYIFDEWRSELAPFDLLLVWGKMTDPAADREISYSQSGRWYYYQYSAKFPFDRQYVIEHSSNNHIIPATENLKSALSGLHKNQDILLKGYLVNADGNYKGGKYWWHTSLSRGDEGDGSCELFYVTRLETNGKVYE
jgi:hypothetical protein